MVTDQPTEPQTGTSPLGLLRFAIKNLRADSLSRYSVFHQVNETMNASVCRDSSVCRLVETRLKRIESLQSEQRHAGTPHRVEKTHFNS